MCMVCSRWVLSVKSIRKASAMVKTFRSEFASFRQHVSELQQVC